MTRERTLIKRSIWANIIFITFMIIAVGILYINDGRLILVLPTLTLIMGIFLLRNDLNRLKRYDENMLE
ncbi:hypothetical protein [Bacillus horti]|uniref:ABC-type bacteriocin/lantibiotic exporter with double-glycine peptidase domain n=1 Tax=Caldalkalibacillus horti TaxID=77523 RepID=A0ABT9W0C6_9BACI|nr:hypothetical protein [Bacillus horti]MDQ0166716.1 ABC-type bacteriocin/lantibiotic exporter with double-glycine peptidase domain [Bacillus horti]